MTLPFSASASPMASSDSSTAESMKPQVLTITRSALPYLGATSYPSARKRVRMRSESTSALGQPKLTKPTLGLLRLTDFTLFRRWRRGRDCTPKPAVNWPFNFEPKRPINRHSGGSAVLSAISHCQIPVREICDLAQVKPRSEGPVAAQEPRVRSDKDFECVTGPP